jgi:hypothetical protein
MQSIIYLNVLQCIVKQFIGSAAGLSQVSNHHYHFGKKFLLQQIINGLLDRYPGTVYP